MTRTVRGLTCGIAIVLAVLAAPTLPIHAAAPTQHGNLHLDATLRAAVDNADSEPQRVIIRTRPGSRAAVRDSLVAHGDQIVTEHDSLDALTAVVHGGDLAELGSNGAVLSVSCDAIVHPHGLVDGLDGLVGGLVQTVGSILLPNGADTSGPVVVPAILRQTLGVDSTSWTGRGIGVAIIDSGLEMSSEFHNRVTAFYNFTNGQARATSPFDDYGHGTHIAGTVGGSGALSSNNAYHGLAPKVKFIVLKVLDKTGAGYTSDVIRAIGFAVANKESLGIDIINLSLGHPIFEPAATDPLVQAVEAASRAGIVVVAASGNYGKNPTTGQPGYGGVTSPGNAPSATTVGAVKIQNTVTRGDDRIADYSSAGPTWYDAFVKPDIVSPGHNIVAVAAKKGYLYQTYPQLKASDGDYMLLSGTSMATAVTTGSVALLLEANRAANNYPTHPSLTPNAVKALLQYTSVGIHDALGVEYNPLRKGAGSLNSKGAIDLGRTVDTSAPRGTYWLTMGPNPYHWTTIGSETVTWGETVIWGSTGIWGSTIPINQAAWASTVIWGSSTSWSSTVIWGSNVVWSNPQSWADTVIWGSDSIGQSSGTTVIWGSTSGMNAQNTAWKDLSGQTATGSTAGQ